MQLDPQAYAGRERVSVLVPHDPRKAEGSKTRSRSDAVVIFQDIETPGEDPVQVDACNRVDLGPLGKWASSHFGDI